MRCRPLKLAREEGQCRGIKAGSLSSCFGRRAAAVPVECVCVCVCVPLWGKEAVSGESLVVELGIHLIETG